MFLKFHKIYFAFHEVARLVGRPNRHILEILLVRRHTFVAQNRRASVRWLHHYFVIQEYFWLIDDGKGMLRFLGLVLILMHYLQREVKEPLTSHEAFCLLKKIDETSRLCQNDNFGITVNIYKKLLEIIVKFDIYKVCYFIYTQLFYAKL